MKFRRNKARYTAIPIECAWAGAVCEIKKAFRQDQWAKISQKCRKIKKSDGRVDRRTDGIAYLRLKSEGGRQKCECMGKKEGKKGKEKNK